MAFDRLKNILARARYVLIGIGILVVAFLVVGAMHVMKTKPEKEETPKAALVVRATPAMLKEQTVSSNFQGEVRAKTNIELVTQVTGKVMSVSDKFIEGGSFQAGETLLQIDDSDYLVALKAAEASVASAKVDLEVEQASAKTNEREWRELQALQGNSDVSLKDANPLRLNKPQVSRAIARLDAAKAELAAAKLNYDRTRISAPFAGRIMTKTAELGQFLARGASVGRVFATDAMEVRIPMTDVQLDELGLTLGYSSSSLGDQSAKSLNEQSALAATVSAVFGIQPHSWQGYLKSVDASVDNQTRLIYATVVVDKPFGDSDVRPMPLAPGLFVDVSLASPAKLRGLEVPRTALRHGNEVYVFDNDELKLKSVKVIYTSQDTVMLTDDQRTDLVDGDQVIVSSVPGAYDGMPIKLHSSSQANVQTIRSNAVEGESVNQRSGQEVLAEPELIEAELSDEEQTPPTDTSNG